ncbi:hypothetical protein MPSI1_001908 [Malassezia psittaci]|uniref:5'-deoxynucleotidase n=1 Tax=Malassezia psittaci TaxID=1821823 RepID=A0AAF0FB63_9BASI|nr:hypothetical protein MPSI1_001908 [Malassezia psittaci]
MESEGPSLVWACPCLNIRIGCASIGKNPAPFSKCARLEAPNALTIALPRWTRELQRNGLDIVSCKVCCCDVYASQIVPEKSSSISEVLHTSPWTPTAEVLISDACIPESVILSLLKSPDYIPAFGIVLPRSSAASQGVDSAKIVQEFEKTWALLHLPDVPSRLKDAEHAPLQDAEASELRKLHDQHDLLQQEISQFVQQAQKQLQVAISKAKKETNAPREVTPSSPAALSHVSNIPVQPSKPAHTDSSRTIFSKRHPVSNDGNPSVGILSASLAKMGPDLAAHVQQADNTKTDNLADFNEDRSLSPESPMEPSGIEPDQSDESAEEPLLVDDKMEDSSEPSVFQIDEDISTTAQRPMSQAVSTRLSEMDEVPVTKNVNQKLSGGMGFSFSMLAEQGVAGMRANENRLHRLEEAYETDQQGPYDLQGGNAMSQSFSQRRSDQIRPSAQHDRYEDDDLALAGVFASNLPSHRHSKHTWNTEPKKPHQSSLASSVPDAQAIPIAFPQSRQGVRDNLDREPKTSLPYKERLMVPSLLKATRAKRVPDLPSNASSKPSIATLRTDSSHGFSASFKAPPIPKVPFVPSATLKVSLGPSSAPRKIPKDWDTNVDTPSKLDKVLYYMHFLQNLKLSKRTGWYHHGISAPESIADHMYRMALLAMLIDSKELDISKCVMMALVHDLAEAQVGDLTPLCNVSKDEKQRLERSAIEYFTKDLLQDSTAGRHIRSLWEEYEQRSSEESRLVKDLDCFELCLQAYEYEHANNTRDLQQFWQGAIVKIQHEQVREWATYLLHNRRQLWTGRGEPYDSINNQSSHS